ncbi:3'-5' exonuclease [Yersinia ruckeri]|uniref:3'-5' exonuclease n=1 Tax=Yersinia ruckeri TaxID=29486 RepID=UPI003B981CEC
MIDIETLDVKSTAVILSIAAVFFEPTSGDLGHEFYVSISTDIEQIGRTTSISTISWWLKQSDEARSAVTSTRGKSLVEALTDLSSFIEKYSVDEVQVWGNGKDFDCEILQNAYAWAGLECPWHFRNTLDVRTIVALGISKGLDPKRTLEFVGTKHNALDDAKFQVAYLSNIYMNLSKKS